MCYLIKKSQKPYEIIIINPRLQIIKPKHSLNNRLNNLSWFLTSKNTKLGNSDKLSTEDKLKS